VKLGVCNCNCDVLCCAVCSGDCGGGANAVGAAQLYRVGGATCAVTTTAGLRCGTLSAVTPVVGAGGSVLLHLWQVVVQCVYLQLHRNGCSCSHGGCVIAVITVAAVVGDVGAVSAVVTMVEWWCPVRICNHYGC
jgi:hypothetical protein